VEILLFDGTELCPMLCLPARLPMSAKLEKFEGVIVTDTRKIWGQSSRLVGREFNLPLDAILKNFFL
jgi:hypothetical protein